MKKITRSLQIFGLVVLLLAGCGGPKKSVASPKNEHLIADFLGICYIEKDNHVVRIPFSERQTKDYHQEIGHLNGFENVRSIYAEGDAQVGAITFDNTFISADMSTLDARSIQKCSDVIDFATNGLFCEVFVHTNGTVTITDRSGTQDGKFEDSWSHIVQVAMTEEEIVGLTDQGTVCCQKDSDFRDVYKSWSDVNAIYGCPGNGHIFAIKSDGTLLYTGEDLWGETQVSDWKDITAIAPERTFTVGLCSDGSVVAVGENTYGQCNVSTWEDIVAIATSSSTNRQSETVYTTGIDTKGNVWITGVIDGVSYSGIYASILENN